MLYTINTYIEYYFIMGYNPKAKTLVFARGEYYMM